MAFEAIESYNSSSNLNLNGFGLNPLQGLPLRPSQQVWVLGALILARLNGELSLKLIKYASIETVKLTAMIFMILIGATAFSLVFNELGGQDLALDFFANDIGDKWSFIFLSMALIFILGFFIDFIEIAFVVVPILVPIVHSFGIDPRMVCNSNSPKPSSLISNPSFWICPILPKRDAKDN